MRRLQIRHPGPLADRRARPPRLGAALLVVVACWLHAAPASAQLPGSAPQAEDTATELIETRSPEERQEEDLAAEEELQALFARMSGLEQVRVEVEAGLASLTGTVPSAERRERAGDLARRIEGVTFVDNRIDLSPSIADQLEPALERIGARLGDFVVFLPLLFLSLLVVAAFFLLATWVGRLERPYGLFSSNLFVQNVIRQVVRAVVGLTGILLAVELLDITALVGAVVGTAGVAGLALGFAFKDIVENYLAGLLLALRQPFAPNDLVLLQDRLGKVVRLTSRETLLMDLDGNHVRVPNATVFRSVLVNYSRNPRRRFELEFSVAPDADLSHALAVGRDVLREMPGVLDAPDPNARVERIGDSAVALVFAGWIDQARSDWLKARSEAFRLILEALQAEGVDMPPPEQRIHLMREPRERPKGERPSGAEATDVTPDRTLDEQIESDRRASDEEDLLRG